MGLTFHDAKRLWEARLSGICFESILTCTHLQLFLQRLPNHAAAEKIEDFYRSSVSLARLC
jgi:hypothetical protein